MMDKKEQNNTFSLYEFFFIEHDILILSAAMFAFSLGFQMTSRYIPEYITILGATPFIIGIYGTFSNIINAIYPYPGGFISDHIGSRYALTIFGFLATSGFLLWLSASFIGTITIANIKIEPWIWVFIGLVLSQAWKSLGIGATFAIVKQSSPSSKLVRGFASTEVFRRIAFLIGPLLASIIIFISGGSILPGFIYILIVAIIFGAFGTLIQHILYSSGKDIINKKPKKINQLLKNIYKFPTELHPLLIGDTLVRFANGMVYIFFIIVITRFLEVDLTVFGYYISPEVFFGVLLGFEMITGLIIMGPASRISEIIGLKPIITFGFAIYSIFPILLIFSPSNPLIISILFSFSGFRFAGLPSHKALIVKPAQKKAEGSVTGIYYLIRNTITIPSAAIGGILWSFLSPEFAFSIATIIGLSGTIYFIKNG